jgi:ABC-2 type transport system permease protein
MQRLEDETMSASFVHDPGESDVVQSSKRWEYGRYGSLYGALVKNSIVREMNFRTNFILWIFVELLWFVLQLTFNNVIYLHTDQIGSWTKWHVVMLIGCSHFIQQIFQTIFLVNCSNLCELVRTGRFDFMLAFPINARFLVSMRHSDLGGIFSAMTGLAVMIYAGYRLQLHPSLPQILLFALLCGAAVLLHYSLMFLMATASFWTVRAQGLVMAYYNLFSVARMPDAAFKGSMRGVFSVAVPMLLIANVPVKVLTNLLGSPWEIGLMLGLTIAWFALSHAVWKRALRAYTSASS